MKPPNPRAGVWADHRGVLCGGRCGWENGPAGPEHSVGQDKAPDGAQRETLRVSWYFPVGSTPMSMTFYGSWL